MHTCIHCLKIPDTEHWEGSSLHERGARRAKLQLPKIDVFLIISIATITHLIRETTRRNSTIRAGMR